MEILGYIVVSLIPSLALVYFFKLHLDKQNEKDINRLSIELKKERQNAIFPSKLEAYQRVILLLERINPQSLIMRLHQPGLAAKQFQSSLLASIREEFDHNIAQQLFISTQAWDLVKKSKEETIKIINIAGREMKEDATANELSNKIFEIVAELEELPTEIAVKILKEEFKKQF